MTNPRNLKRADLQIKQIYQLIEPINASANERETIKQSKLLFGSTEKVIYLEDPQYGVIRKIVPVSDPTELREDLQSRFLSITNAILNDRNKYAFATISLFDSERITVGASLEIQLGQLLTYLFLGNANVQKAIELINSIDVTVLDRILINGMPLLHGLGSPVLINALFMRTKSHLNLTIDNEPSALMNAVISNKKDVVQLLLEKGANIDYMDKNGRTAETMAKANNNKIILQILTDHRKKLRTNLQQAEYNNNNSIQSEVNNGHPQVNNGHVNNGHPQTNGVSNDRKRLSIPENQYKQQKRQLVELPDMPDNKAVVLLRKYQLAQLHWVPSKDEMLFLRRGRFDLVYVTIVKKSAPLCADFDEDKQKRLWEVFRQQILESLNYGRIYSAINVHFEYCNHFHDFGHKNRVGDSLIKAFVIAIHKEKNDEAMSLIDKIPAQLLNAMVLYNKRLPNFLILTGKVELLKELIERGLEVNYPSHGTPPLSIAVFIGSEMLVKLLLVKGADIDALDPFGKTVDAYLDHKKNPEIIKILADHRDKLTQGARVQSMSSEQQQSQERVNVIQHVLSDLDKTIAHSEAQQKYLQECIDRAKRQKVRSQLEMSTFVKYAQMLNTKAKESELKLKLTEINAQQAAIQAQLADVKKILIELPLRNGVEPVANTLMLSNKRSVDNVVVIGINDNNNNNNNNNNNAMSNDRSSNEGSKKIKLG